MSLTFPITGGSRWKKLPGGKIGPKNDENVTLPGTLEASGVLTPAVKVDNEALADEELSLNFVNAWIDEANDILHLRVKKSNGTIVDFQLQ